MVAEKLMRGKSGKMLVDEASESSEIDENNLRDFVKKSVTMIEKKQRQSLELVNKPEELTSSFSSSSRSS